MTRKSSAAVAGAVGRIGLFNKLRDEALASSYLLAYQQATPDLTLKVASATLYVNGSLLSFAGTNSPTFTAPATNPRIDTLSLSPAGALVRTAGTPAISPVAPNVPAGHIPICQVYNRSTQTSIKDVDDSTNGYVLLDTRPFLTDDQSTFSFTADEDLAASTPVGASNYYLLNRVARAIRKLISQAHGIAGVSGTLTQPTSRIFPVGGNKFVVLFRNSPNLSAVACSVDPATKEVSIGTPVNVTTDISVNDIFGGCSLGTDKFTVFYQETASTVNAKARAATISGLTITFGTAVTAITGASAIADLKADRLATDKGVFIMRCSTNTDSKVVAFTTSGTVHTFGTPVAPSTNITSNTSVVKIGTDKFAIGCDNGYIQAGTVSGTTITLGTALQFTTTISQNLGFWDMISLTTDVIVMRYRESGSNTSARVVCVTFSGTTGSAGTPLTGYDNQGFLLADTATSFLLFTQATGSGGDRLKKLTRSGNTLTDVGAAIWHFSGSGSTKCVVLDSGLIITVVGGSTTIDVWIAGMSNNFIGFVKAAVSKDGTAQVQSKGVVGGFSGLVPGAVYQVTNGGLVIISSDVLVNSLEDIKTVIAISDTQIVM